MKRYLAPILVLLLLFAAGGSLWSQSRPAVAEQPPQTVAEELPPAEAPETPESADVSAPEPEDQTAPAEPTPETSAPADAAQTEAVPPPAEPSKTSPPAPEVTQPAPSEPESAETAAPAEAPAAEPKQPESLPAASDTDLSALAQDLLNEINRERAGSGAPALTLDTSLSAIAGLRATECTSKFSHTRPDGSSYRSAVDSAGIAYQSLGENLATGYLSANAVMQGWKGSDSHHDNVINQTFTRAGIGLAENTGNPYQGYVWVVIFCG